MSQFINFKFKSFYLRRFQVIMVTGDHPITAKAIAKNVGIISAGIKFIKLFILLPLLINKLVRLWLSKSVNTSLIFAGEARSHQGCQQVLYPPKLVKILGQVKLCNIKLYYTIMFRFIALRCLALCYYIRFGYVITLNYIYYIVKIILSSKYYLFWILFYAKSGPTL